MGAKNWSDIRRSKIAPGQAAAAIASSQALRDALAMQQEVALRALRSSRGVTQVELAQRLGKSQGNVSELERRDDVYLSSLREYVEALGGRLEIEAVFDNERRPIAISRPVAAARAASGHVEKGQLKGRVGKVQGRPRTVDR